MNLLSNAALALASMMMSAPTVDAQPAAAPPAPIAAPEVVPPASTAEAPSPPAIVAPPCCKLPALTVVELEIMDPTSSRTSQVGQKVRIRTAEPVQSEGQVILPQGTEGFAEVIQASKARMMGKGGELVLGLPYLELKGQRIPLKRMRYGKSTGKGNDMLTTVAVASIGLPGLLISGGNIDIAQGARANAVVTTDTVVALQP